MTRLLDDSLIEKHISDLYTNWTIASNLELNEDHPRTLVVLLNWIVYELGISFQLKTLRAS